MPEVYRDRGLKLYVSLTALFICALVACNLIANKFIAVDLGFYEFTISAGVLPYPVTFLITDLLSEIFGRKKTNLVVFSGFLALLFVMLILYLGGLFDALSFSNVQNEDYDLMFGNSKRVIIASMVAYLAAQFIDVRLYHFWKKLTKGKYLWLRNNASTFLSMFVDTTLVVIVLFYGVESFNTILGMILSGWLFKIICAFVDTPFLYLGMHLARKYLGLKGYEEFEF